MPGVNVELAVGGVCVWPHVDLPIVEVGSAVGDVCGPLKRTCAAADLPRVAAQFGEDLACADLDALPSAWLSPPAARRVLTGAGVSPERIDVLDVYARSARWTSACEAAGLRASLSHGVDILGGGQWDLTTKGGRRLGFR